MMNFTPIWPLPQLKAWFRFKNTENNVIRNKILNFFLFFILIFKKLDHFFKKSFTVRISRTNGWNWGPWCWWIDFRKLFQKYFPRLTFNDSLGPWICYWWLFQFFAFSPQKGKRIKIWKDRTGLQKLFKTDFKGIFYRKV